MRLWRISRYASLDGEGGIRAPGRWHTNPRAVIYCADHPATALLEVLVHLEVSFDEMPQDYQLIEIDFPDHLPSRGYGGNNLPSFLYNNLPFCRAIGDEWFNQAHHVALSVPSAIVPFARIHILNAAHPQFGSVSVKTTRPLTFDPRLWESN